MTGNELREKRNQLGWSQEKLARALDTAGNTIARWEAKKDKHFSTSNLVKFAVEWLLLEQSRNNEGNEND